MKLVIVEYNPYSYPNMHSIIFDMSNANFVQQIDNYLVQNFEEQIALYKNVNINDFSAESLQILLNKMSDYKDYLVMIV